MNGLLFQREAKIKTNVTTEFSLVFFRVHMGLRKSLEFYKSLPNGLNHDQEALMGYFYSFIEESNFLFYCRPQRGLLQ